MEAAAGLAIESPDNLAQPQQRRAFDGGLQQRGGLGDLRQQKAAGCVHLPQAAFKDRRQLFHLQTHGLGRGRGLPPAAEQQLRHPQFGGAQFLKTGQSAVQAAGAWAVCAGLRLKMLGQRHGAGDEQVRVLKQDHQVMPLCGLGLVFGADGGYRSPALLDRPADAVLVVLGQAVPEGGSLPDSMSGRGSRLLVFHPFARKQAKGWGAQVLAGGELGHGAEEGGQFLVASAYCRAGGAVGVQRPQKQREQRRPGATGEQQ